MNKKLLFAAMSLAALTACSTDDLESQQVAEQAGSVEFEVINNGVTRASMNESEHKIVWSATDGDLFTLYHGGTVSGTPLVLSTLQNATYTANASTTGSATLTTPSMIQPGKAIMVWPVDTVFSNDGGNVSITIPAVQTNIENNIPYVSDLIDITARTDGKAVYNYAGYNRKYPVYMRPMASQLIVKAEYNGTDAVLAPLAEGATGIAAGDGIDPISVTSIALSATTEQFTTTIPLNFTAITDGDADDLRWDAAVPDNAWSHKTGFGTTYTAQSTTLTAKGDCLLDGNKGCTFLILPQKTITTADETSAVIVNTNYGKVVVGAAAAGSDYTTTEAADAWYRYLSAATAAADGETKAEAAEASGDNAGKFKTYAKVEDGMKQTLNVFSAFTAPAGTGIVDGEPMGTWTTRYVKVLLNHLDMTGLHITSDKQLYDVVRVWNLLEQPTLTLALDGDENGEFVISQKTIAKINEINAAAAAEGRSFTVMPCTETDEECETIVITGGGEIQDLAFIKENSGTKAAVALAAETTWNWVGTVTVAGTSCGISSFINNGTMENAADATLAIYNDNATPAQVTDIPLENKGTWDIKSGKLYVQFDVTNLGTVNISSGAQYRQDGTNNTFTNEAKTLPQRFLAEGETEEIGVVNNSGVFATVGTGKINNYGLIEHAAGAKTYITENQQGTSPSFANAFNAASGSENKLGQINLMWSNKDDENVAISNNTQDGFVSVTITADNAPSNKTLAATSVATFVNYIIVEGGITKVTGTPTTAKPLYVELNQPGTEVIWGASGTNPYAGLILLSDINIQRGVAVKATVTYLDADIYQGGAFTCTDFDGYYGDTSAKEATNIITW